MNPHREIGADLRGQVLQRGRGNAGDGAVVEQQALLGLLADALDIAQGAVDGRFGAEVAMEGDAEAVGFVADLLQDAEGLRVPVDEKGIGVADADHLLEALSQTDDGHPVEDIQLQQRLVGEFKLALTAVDDDQLRQVIGILLQHAGIAAVDDFLHGGVVVGADDRLDLEAAVVLLGGHAVAEDDAGGDGVGTLDVGVVEALHVARQVLHAEGLAEILHDRLLIAVGVGVLALAEAAGIELAGVLGAELQQGQLVAALGDAEFDAGNVHVGQERHDDLAGEGAELILDLADKGGEERFLLFLDLAPEAEIEGLDDGAATDAEEIAESLSPVEDHREDIGIRVDGLGDDGLGVVPLEGGDPVLVLLRRLEVQALGRFGHQGLVVTDDFPAAAAEDADNLVDVGLVLLPGDFSQTGGLALADVHLEAGTQFPAEDGVGGDFEVAGAQGVDFLKEVDEMAGVQGAAVGTEIAVALAFVDPPGDKYPGEFLAGHADPGIGLRILEEYVVAGLILLDEIVLQQQGIRLGVDHGILRVGDFADQDAGLGIEPLRRHEVLGDALVEVLGLAHINNLSLGVIISVDAGGMGE